MGGYKRCSRRVEFDLQRQSPCALIHLTSPWHQGLNTQIFTITTNHRRNAINNPDNELES